jgi:endo-1,3-1,4-beta-glycanase ExoK
MNPVWRFRAAAGLGLGLAIACALLLKPAEVTDPFTAVADEPVKIAAKANTGKKPDDGFIMDLKAGFDVENHYLAEYEMDTEWIRIAYKPSNIRWSKTGMKLELRKTAGKLPVSGAEFQRSGHYGFGRYEAILKASDAHGAISSFFTYTGPTFGDPHDEIDFEFIGRSPRSVHLNYFVKGESDPKDIPLWFDTAMADHLYAFEWTPDSIRWYVDGHKIYEVTSKTTKIPTASGKVIANIWAGTGSATSWTGEPRFQLASAEYRCMSHVPIGKTGPQCSDTFKAPPKP